MKQIMKKRIFLIIKTLLAALILLSLFSCRKKEEKEEAEIKPAESETAVTEKEEETKEEPVREPVLNYSLEIFDEDRIILESADGYYRYGPSIISYDDGTYDAWFASPGNSGSQWDWIRYRHSEDGKEWSDETIVLQPTPGSKDRCSICDPGLIYFDGYYYMGYTATDYYEGKGTYNMAYAARSRNPDGPFEKWNGKSWGGDPEPIIFYDGGQDNWGIGEISFVILDEDLFIYYTYIDIRDRYVGLYKADLVEDWPTTMRNKGPVLYRLQMDSVEVVYDENLELFLAFSINNRMSEDSELVMFVSANGKDFSEVFTSRENMEEFAHNMGVAKSLEGHVDTSNQILIGYAYGENWGRWNISLQKIKIATYYE